MAKQENKNFAQKGPQQVTSSIIRFRNIDIHYWRERRDGFFQHFDEHSLPQPSQ